MTRSARLSPTFQMTKTKSEKKAAVHQEGTRCQTRTRRTKAPSVLIRHKAMPNRSPETMLPKRKTYRKTAAADEEMTSPKAERLTLRLR